MCNCFSSEKSDFVVTHLLEFMAYIGILVQIKTDIALAYVCKIMKQIFIYYNIKNIGSTTHNLTGSANIEISN